MRIRFIKLGMDHPTHIHGHTFQVTGTEGGRIRASASWPGITLLVGVAQARNVEFVANHPGDWMLHCHTPHDLMKTGEPGQPAGEGYGSSLAGHGIRQRCRHGNGDSPLSAPAASASMVGMMAVGMMAKDRARSWAHPDGCGVDGKHPGEEHGRNGANREEHRRQCRSCAKFRQDACKEKTHDEHGSESYAGNTGKRGLRGGWSAYMQGMMNLSCVLPSDRYDAVIAKMRDALRPGDPYAALLARA